MQALLISHEKEVVRLHTFPKKPTAQPTTQNIFKLLI